MRLMLLLGPLAADGRAEGDGRAGALLRFGAMHFMLLLRPLLRIWRRS